MALRRHEVNLINIIKLNFLVYSAKLLEQRLRFLSLYRFAKASFNYLSCEYVLFA